MCLPFDQVNLQYGILIHRQSDGIVYVGAGVHETMIWTVIFSGTEIAELWIIISRV